MKPPLLSGNEAIRAFLRAGFVRAGQRGSHVKLFNHSSQTTIIIPNHKELDRWTLKSIIKDSGLSVEEFNRLRK